MTIERERMQQREYKQNLTLIDFFQKKVLRKALAKRRKAKAAVKKERAI